MLGGPKGEGRAGGPTLQRAQAFVLIQFSFGGPAFLVKFRSIPCFPPDYTNYAVGSILFYVLCGSLAGASHPRRPTTLLPTIPLSSFAPAPLGGVLKNLGTSVCNRYLLSSGLGRLVRTPFFFSAIYSQKTVGLHRANVALCRHFFFFLI